MPPLARTKAKRLLRTVGNKQHATDDDHASNGLRTPPATSSTVDSMPTAPRDSLEEDYTRSPDSSDAEATDVPLRVTATSKRAGDNLHTQREKSFKRPAEVNDTDDLFGSSQAAKRPRFKRITYGSSQARSSQRGSAPKPTVIQDPTPRAAAFKTAKNADVFEFNSSPSSSLLSSPPSSPEILDMTDIETSLQVHCPVCEAKVDLLIKQEYEDLFKTTTGERELNIRRQHAFCRYHTQHDARQLWRTRRYPVIDWATLEQRMQRKHARLKKIIGGQVNSTYRDRLTHQIANRSTSNASAGYYGPRGQKAMMEHILGHLSDALRDASRTDSLIMAAGRDAGLSGFVQGVLVPELAADLIMEDMRVSREEACSILGASKELGELLNEEERDVVVIAESEPLQTS